MVRDVEVEKLTCSELDDHEDVETLERRGDHDQEIAGYNVPRVIMDER